MKLTIEIEDDEMETFAKLIAANVTPGTTADGEEPETEDAGVDEDDDLAGDAPAAKEKGPTLEQVQDAITAAAKLNKPAVKALLAKHGVERGSELGKDKYAKFLEGLKKVKKA